MLNPRLLSFVPHCYVFVWECLCECSRFAPDGKVDTFKSSLRRQCTNVCVCGWMWRQCKALWVVERLKSAIYCECKLYTVLVCRTTSKVMHVSHFLLQKAQVWCLFFIKLSEHKKIIECVKSQLTLSDLLLCMQEHTSTPPPRTSVVHEKIAHPQTILENDIICCSVFKKFFFFCWSILEVQAGCYGCTLMWRLSKKNFVRVLQNVQKYVNTAI